MSKGDCPKCDGYGKFYHGHEAGFDSRNMEIYAKEITLPCGYCECSGLVEEKCEECESTVGIDVYKDKHKEGFLLCKPCSLDFIDRNKDAIN